MARPAQDWCGAEPELLTDLVAADEPSPDLFWRVAKVALERNDQLPTAHLMRAVGRAAWLDAASELLTLALPQTGYMAGRLPNGSAHVRLMVKRRAGGAMPVDTYRGDGDVALALLEALLQATHVREAVVYRAHGRLDA